MHGSLTSYKWLRYWLHDWLGFDFWQRQRYFLLVPGGSFPWFGAGGARIWHSPPTGAEGCHSAAPPHTSLTVWYLIKHSTFVTFTFTFTAYLSPHTWTRYSPIKLWRKIRDKWTFRSSWGMHLVTQKLVSGHGSDECRARGPYTVFCRNRVTAPIILFYFIFWCVMW
jgi:hypothetical protein